MSYSPPTGIIAWFVRNSVAANLLMMSLLVIGVLATQSMRVEVFPGIPPKFVSIDVTYNSGSATDTEEGIILKVEDALQGVEGIKNITATATTDHASVRVERSTGYDLDVLNDDIKNKIDALALPDSAESPVITQATKEDQAIAVQVTGDVEHAVLQETARRLRRLLLSDPNIKKVDTAGDHEIEIQLEIDEDKLQAYGLTLSEVATQINASSFVSRGGELDSGDGNIILKASTQLYQANSFGDVEIINEDDGRKIFLSDIATIKETFDGEDTLSRFNGKPSIALSVIMFGDSDVLAIAPAVQAVVEKFQPLTPANIEVAAWNSQSDYISERLNLISKNALQGMLIVGLLLALFLNLRVALWVVVGIPVTFAGAMILIGPVHGISINELSTFGFLMALGIVVDDAVVVGESIHHERTKYGATIDNTIRGTHRVAIPTLFGVLTSVAAFQAIPFIQGEMGSIFGIFATVIVCALLVSMVESKLILPAHLAHMSTKPPHRLNYPSKAWSWVQTKFANGMNYFSRSIFRPFLYRLLPFRYAVFAASLAGIVLAVGLVTSGRVGFVFFPDVPGDTITVSLSQESDVGYELTQSNVLKIERSVTLLNKELREQGETVDVINNLQVQSDKTSGTLVASLSPRDDRNLGTKDIVAEWEKRLPALEGVASLNFVTSWQGASAIQIELRSENSTTLQQASQAVMDGLRAIEGVKNPENNLKAGQAQINLRLKPAGEAMGLSLQELSTQLSYAYDGRDVQDFQRGENEVTVKLSYSENKRKNIADLKEMRVRLSDGTIVPLDAVATLETIYVNEEINRLNSERVATITSDVDKSVIAPSLVNQQLSETLFPTLLANYSDLSISLGGEAEQQAETAGSMMQLAVITLIVIYVLLAVPLKSYFQPLIIMSAIPFGVIGALLGHWFYGSPLSILSIFGIVALSGVVVNDSLLLVTRYNELKQSGMSNRKAVTEAASQRMRAVILTSVTTFAGLAPLMAETSENAQYLIPTALSIAYGSLFATIITLVIIPTLLLITTDFHFSKKVRQPRQLELEGVPL